MFQEVYAAEIDKVFGAYDDFHGISSKFVIIFKLYCLKRPESREIFENLHDKWLA